MNVFECEQKLMQKIDKLAKAEEALTKAQRWKSNKRLVNFLSKEVEFVKEELKNFITSNPCVHKTTINIQSLFGGQHE